MISSVLYYILYSSVFLVYGLGLSRLITLHESIGSLFLTCVKTLITAACTVSLAYLIIRYLLVPVGLSELYPFIIVIVYVCISIIIEVFASIGIADSVTELAVPLISIILAVNEQPTLARILIVVTACISAFYLLELVIYSLRMRFEIFASRAGIGIYTLLLVSLAVIVIALCSWNISWLTLINNWGGV